MRILFAIRLFHGGGAERVISVLSSALAAQGNDVALLLEKQTENDYPIHPEIKVYTFEPNYMEKYKSKTERALKRINMIRGAIEDFRPDTVIPFLPDMVREVFFAAKKYRNIITVGTIRNNADEMPYLKRAAFLFVLNHSPVVYLQTEAQKRFLGSRAQKRSFVLSNPVDASFFSDRPKLSERPRNLITCGRLNKQKNMPMLINAVCSVHETYPDISLDIFGSGEEKEKLQSLIDELGASSYIALRGRTDDVAQALRDSDIFVLSSDYEGLPNALMEAMAVGLPCISTDCPTGPADLLGQAERGLLVNVGDNEGLQNAIERFISDPGLAADCAKKAHAYARDAFSADRIAKKLLSEINKITGREREQ